MPLRIYLAGPIYIENGDIFTGEGAFVGRQARVAFAYLALAHGNQVAREELADAVWGEHTPPSWEDSLNALTSRFRRVLTLTQLPRDWLVSRFGCLSLSLPADTWIDVECAQSSIDLAETHSRTGRMDEAWNHANVACIISGRPFLAGDAGEWVERQRRRLRDTHLRALDVLTEVYLSGKEPTLAIAHANEAISLDSMRESSYRHLMQAHHFMGNRAAALQTFDRCRRTLDEELGVPPSQETQALFLEILKA